MSAPRVIEINPDLVLKGQLSLVNDVVVTGQFEGELQTRGRLTVAAGAVVKGSVEAGALVLEPGYTVEGKIKVGPPPGSKIVEAVKKIKAGKWPLRFKKLKDFALSFGRRS